MAVFVRSDGGRRGASVGDVHTFERSERSKHAETGAILHDYAEVAQNSGTGFQ